MVWEGLTDDVAVPEALIDSVWVIEIVRETDAVSDRDSVND